MEPYKVREVTDLRTEYAKTFQLSNGQYLCEVHASSIHYKDTQNEFKDINNSIKDADKEGYRYSNTANAWHTRFGDTVSQKNAVVLEKDGYSISFNLADANIIASAQKANALNNSESKIDQQLKNDNTAVVYKNVYENVDIVYTHMNAGLKEDIILRNKDVPDTFVFDIELNGLNLVEEEGAVFFVNNLGEKKFMLNSLFMEDANEKVSYKVGYTIYKQDSRYRLTIKADIDFINAADTLFPVIIDPTLTVYGSSSTYDSYVCSAHPTYNYNYGSSDPISTAYTKLRTGKDSPYGVRRTYIRFDRPTIPSYAYITSAYLKLYKLDSAGALNMTAYRVKSSWNSSTITWNNKPAYDDANDSGVAGYLGDNWYRMNVTFWINAFYLGAASDYGFCIRDSNESSTNVWATFASSDYSGSSYDPVLQVTYSVDSVNYSNVKLLSEARFRATHADSGNVMTDWLLFASMAFRNTYNLQLIPGPCYDGSNFPGALCTTGDNNACSFSICGSLCQNNKNTPNHHKNGLRNLYLSRDLGLSGHDLQLFFAGHYLEHANSAGTGHDYSYYGITEFLNGSYVIISTRFDYYSNIRTIQHELSHCYGCQDPDEGDGCSGSQLCIMRGSFDIYDDVFYNNIWCDNCENDFNEYLH